MNGSSKGSGLINEEGKIVKEIKDNLYDTGFCVNCGYGLRNPDSPCRCTVQKNADWLVRKDLVNYQNDNMGAPTEEIKKAKVVKFRGKR